MRGVEEFRRNIRRVHASRRRGQNLELIFPEALVGRHSRVKLQTKNDVGRAGSVSVEKSRINKADLLSNRLASCWFSFN